MIEFNGKDKDWDMWSTKHLARGKRKGYAKLSLCRTNKADMDNVPTQDEYDLVVSGT